MSALAEVGSAFVSILPSAKGFGSKLDSEVGGEVDSAGKRTGSRFGTAIKVGAMAVLAGAAIGAKFLSGAIEEAREAQKVGALTAATIKATGGAAGVTAKQVGDLAGALSTKTGIDDEVIQSGQNMLLTFKNIRNESGKGNDIFNQSTKALIDMSAAMGTEPKQAAIQLGKALNDPVKGISALSRVGIQFTEEQKKSIATMVAHGDTAKAQKVILAELESQFGGAAEAQATAGDKAKVAWGNFQEAIGTLLLPLLDNVLNGFTRITNFVSANLGPALATIGQVVGPPLAAVRAAVQGVIASFGGGGGGGGLMAAFQGVSAFIAGSVVPAFMGIVNAVRGFVATALPIVQQFVAGMRARIEPMLPLIQTIFKQIGSVVVGAMNLVKTIIQAATTVIAAVWNKWGSGLMDFAAKIFGNIATVISGALKIIQGIIKVVTSAIKGDWSGVWDGIKQIVSGAWGVIKGVVQAGINLVKGIISGGAAAMRAAMAAAWDAVKQAVSNGIDGSVNLAKSLPGKVTAALGNLGSLLFSKGAELIQGLINGIMSKLGAVGDAIGNVAGKIKGFLPGSPVKEGPLKSWNNGGAGKRLVEMLASGIDDGGPLVTHASNRLASRIATPVAVARPAVALDSLAPGGDDLGAKLDRVAAILERMPKAYRVGERQGA